MMMIMMMMMMMMMIIIIIILLLVRTSKTAATHCLVPKISSHSLQFFPPGATVFYSPLAGFSLLAYEVS